MDSRWICDLILTACVSHHTIYLAFLAHTIKLNPSLLKKKEKKNLQPLPEKISVNRDHDLRVLFIFVWAT
jgi:hypothetical protein